MEKYLNLSVVYAAMEKKGLNAAGIAKELGISREAVSKWLRGVTCPAPDKLLKLALLLELKFGEFVTVKTSIPEPVIAFRKKGGHKIKEPYIAKAKRMGGFLRGLVEHLPFDKIMAPAGLKNPVCDYEYLQEVAKRISKEAGVNEADIFDFHHLFRKFNKIQAVIIPVMWGARENHENALHVYLPDSMTTFIYLNLDSKIHDFKFWMAHELGHCLSPSLTENTAEDFADAFAATLLFPHPLAEQAYAELSSIGNKGSQINKIREIAGKYTISPITVCGQAEAFAKASHLPEIGIGKSIYAATTNFHKEFSTISESLFNGEKPTAKEYIEIAKEQFGSHFFEALSRYIRKSKAGPSYLQTVLDIPLLDAKEMYAELS